jgi:hypothetical protein
MKIAVVACAIAFTVATTASAQEAASLQGRVVRWGSSEPIARATVELVSEASGNPAPYVVQTNGDGAFAFSDIPSGQYRVFAKRSGYVNGEYGQRWPNGAGTPLMLPPGQAVSNVPVPLLQTGTISGVVRDGQGLPLGNATVQAFKASYQTGRRVFTPAQSVQSDDRGEYRLFWLTPGKYFIAARHPNLSTSPIRVGGISMGGGGVGPQQGSDGAALVPRYQQFRTGGDNASASAFEVGGRGAVGNVANVATEKYMAVYYPNTTDETSAAAIDVTPGGEATAIDFAVSAIPIHRVRGRVVYEANNEPAMSARVQWVTPTGMSPSDSDSFMGPMQGATAVECCDGAFEIGLPAGSYTLVAAVNNVSGRAGVSVGDSDIDGIVLAVGRTFNVRGTVTFEGRGATPAELAALRINVAFDPPINGLFPSGYSNVLPNGSFTLPAGRGDFRIGIQPLLTLPNLLPFLRFPAAGAGALAGAFVKSIRLGNVDVLNGGLHLSAETTEPLEVVIGTATGVIEGRVVNRDGQTVPNVVVAIVPDRARLARIDLIKSASSDSSGRFRLNGVPPGDYVAFAFDGVDEGEWQNPEFVAAKEASGKPVRVGPTSSVSVELVALME